MPMPGGVRVPGTAEHGQAPNEREKKGLHRQVEHFAKGSMCVSVLWEESGAHFQKASCPELKHRQLVPHVSSLHAPLCQSAARNVPLARRGSSLCAQAEAWARYRHSRQAAAGCSCAVSLAAAPMDQAVYLRHARADHTPDLV